VTRTIDAALLDVVERLMINVRVVEHGFGGNAADVQARPTEGPTLLYTRGLGENGTWGNLRRRERGGKS
jgi:hypothetical protein